MPLQVPELYTAVHALLNGNRAFEAPDDQPQSGLGGECVLDDPSTSELLFTQPKEK